MGWAVRSWHIVEAKAVVLGLLGRPGGPLRLLDLDARLLLALLEGIARENEKHDKQLTKLYDDARPKSTVPVATSDIARRERQREIQRAMRLFGSA